jgi:hypothetical protein
MENKIRFKIKLTKSQQELYRLATDTSFKYLTVCLSRQQGKSTAMIVLCVQWLLERNIKIGYVCRTSLFAETGYSDLLKILPSQLIKKANTQTKYIETVFGSSIRFFSAESGNSLRGQSFHYLLLDEFAFFGFEQTDGTNLWDNILSPTVKVKGRKCIFVSTPLGKNNKFYEMYLRGLDDNFPQYRSMLRTIYDDGLINKDEIEETRKGIPELAWRQEYMCEFLDSALTFFSGFEECFKKYDYEYEKTWIGVDLSGNGTDATILTKINEKNEVESIEIKGNLDIKYKKIADIINNSKNLQMCYLENNGLGAPMINEIRKLVKDKSKIREWQTTNSSKEEILSELAVRIAQKEISFNEYDKSLYSEFGTFVANYTKNGHLQFGAINGRHDDRIMSLAIGMKAKTDYDVKVTKTFFSVVRI